MKKKIKFSILTSKVPGTDKVNILVNAKCNDSPVKVLKWDLGKRNLKYFKDGKGIPIQSGQFGIHDNGYYTLYAESDSGSEMIKVIKVKKNKVRSVFFGKKATILLAVSIILIGSGALAAYTTNWFDQVPVVNQIVKHPSLDNGTANSGSAPEKSQEEIMDALKKQQIVVTDSVNSNAVFSSGKTGTVGDWIVENSGDNNVLMQAEIYVNDTLVATSAIINPGQYVQHVTLSSDLPSGTYKAEAYINYYTNDSSKNYISKAGYSITMTVS